MLAVILMLALAGDVDQATDAPLVPKSVAMAEPGRFQSSRSYERTVDYYRRLFRGRGGVRWRPIVSLPKLRAVHIASTDENTLWDGINVYENKGDVRIYVLKRVPKTSPESEPSKSPRAR